MDTSLRSVWHKRVCGMTRQDKSVWQSPTPFCLNKTKLYLKTGKASNDTLKNWKRLEWDSERPKKPWMILQKAEKG